MPNDGRSRFLEADAMHSPIGQDAECISHTLYASSDQDTKMLGIVMLPRGFASDWIKLFGPLSVEAALRFVDEIMVGGKRWTYEDLSRMRDHIARRSRSARRRHPTIWPLGEPRPSEHHILAHSRGGQRSKKNIVRLPRGFHSLWHQLFANLTPQEVHQFIAEVMVPGTTWTYTLLRGRQVALMRRAKKASFGT